MKGSTVALIFGGLAVVVVGGVLIANASKVKGATAKFAVGDHIQNIYTWPAPSDVFEVMAVDPNHNVSTSDPTYTNHKGAYLLKDLATGVSTWADRYWIDANFHKVT